MNLLLLAPSDLQSDGSYRVDDSRHLHVRDLLKLRSGDQLSVGVLNGPRGIGRILSTDDLATIIELGPMTLSPAPSVAIDLVCAVPRPKIIRKVLYVAAMFGVRSIHFMRANRTEKSYLDSPLFRDGRFEPYLVAGLSQGEWTRLPEVTVHPPSPAGPRRPGRRRGPCALARGPGHARRGRRDARPRLPVAGGGSRHRAGRDAGALRGGDRPALSREAADVTQQFVFRVGLAEEHVDAKRHRMAAMLVRGP